MSRWYISCGCIAIIDNTQRYLALSSTSVHATVLSSTSRTCLTQTYTNNTGALVEQASYVFPLYDGVSVVAFTCTIGSRVIKGVVKEREEANRAFDEAVAQGKAAALLEQNLSASDVFTTKLGNVPAGEDVKVEITYLGELEHDAELDGLRFTVPTAIAPRYGDDASVSTASAPKVKVQGNITIAVDVDIGPGCVIKSLQSPSHPISVDIGTVSTNVSADPLPQMASASLSLGSAELEKDFVVQVVATGLGSPAALLEVHPTKANHRTIMASLVPRFNLPVERPEIVFICDRSGSMGDGQKIPNLISALKIFLKSLPVGVRFNICSFGSRYSFLWPKSVEYTQQTLDKAVRHVETFSDDYGGTEMLDPVRETFKRRVGETNLEVFLLTDGEIWNQDQLFTLINDEVAASKGSIRVFSLGIGEDVSHALIKGVARAGNGFSQIAGENEKIEKKLVRMLKGALTPHVTDYTLEIKYDKPDASAVSELGDDDFEVVEKVMDALTLEVEEQPVQVHDTTKTEEPKAPISLFNPSIKNEDLEMKDASEELDKAKTSLPPIDAPSYLQTPFTIPSLFPFNRTTVYVMLSDATPSREPVSLVLKGTSRQGPLELEVPITKLRQTGTTLHQLAARKAVQELEDGKGWLYHAKDSGGTLLQERWAGMFPQMVQREGARLGVEYQIGGKWCSFVAISTSGEKDEGKQSIEDTTEIFTEKNEDDSSPADLFKMRMGSRGGFARPKAKVAYASHQQFQVAPMMMAMNFSPAGAAAAEESQDEELGFDLFADQDFSVGECLGGLDSAGQNFAFEEYLEEVPVASMPGFCFDSADPNMLLEVKGNQFPPISQLAGLPGIAALQTFIGTWKWSPQLESIIGVTEKDASAAIKLPVCGDGVDVAELLATLCTVIYLRKALAADKDSWELMADKAENWLQDQTGKTMAELVSLVDGKHFPQVS